MNLEEELQQRAENEKLYGVEKDDLDAKAYVEVFNVLKGIQGYEVPPKFADNVMDKITVKHGTKASIFSNDYFWFGAGLTLLMSLAVATVMMTKVKIDMGFLNAMSAYKGLFIFGVLFVIVLNVLDKRLIRKGS
jgi:hypothetical protein